jgi:NAD(P)-dependent dehydrogenase (short-subunit alcohol dehydrogenase family)
MKGDSGTSLVNAAAIAFPAGENAEFIAGQTLFVDGGFEPWNDLTGKVRPESGSGLQNFGR